MATLTTEGIINRTKARLGFPTIKFELPDETMAQLIQEAVDYINQYVVQYYYKEANGDAVVDMTEEQPTSIIRIYESTPILGQGANDIDIFALASRQSSGYPSSKDIILNKSILSERKNLRTQDHKLVGNKLYLYGYRGLVTIEYTKFTPLEEIKETKYQSWVRNYVLALTKIAIGEIRSKFTLSNFPVAFNGETLKTEGIEEKNKLETLLIEQGEGLFYIERG